MPLHLDYRPQTFEEVVGNKDTINSLKSILARNDRPHAYLFQGPSGCGKTTLARLLAKGLGCDDMELHELNVANTRGIDTIREKIQQGFYAPLAGNIKVFLWDEAHQLLRASEEALLKFIEEPPSHVYNILCTTNPEKLLTTIKTRCSIYTVSSLTSHEMIELMKWILEIATETKLSDKVQNTLVSAADGCPRRLLVMMDQIIDIKDEKDQLTAIVNTTDENVQIIDICRTLIEKGSGVKRWDDLSKLLKTFEHDPEQTRRAVLGYMSKVLLSKKGEDGKRIALLMAEFVEPYYNTGKAGLIVSCYMATLV